MMSYGGNTKLKMMHNWSMMPYKEMSLNKIFKKIGDICVKNKIIKCVEMDAKIMYAQISECKHTTGKNKNKYIITRGINRISIIGACVYFACERKNISRTPKEIAKMFNISLVDINRGCKKFSKLIKQKNFDLNIGICSSENFVMRYCNKLKLKEKDTNTSIMIVKNIDKLKIITDHTPLSIAAASILLMATINNLKTITKKIIASEFEISVTTLIKTYKKILLHKNNIFNNDDKCNNDDNIENNKNTTIKLPLLLIDRMIKFGINYKNTKYIFETENENKIRQMKNMIEEIERIKKLKDIFCTKNKMNKNGKKIIFINNIYKKKTLIIDKKIFNKKITNKK
jgi:transcription initiation factor TFIIIB Brf1 subunit/transcription initiation factor TFIIB